MITLKELVEQQKAQAEEPCYVEENEDVDIETELSYEELTELEDLVDNEPGLPYSATMEHYKGRYESGMIQRDIPKHYGPGAFRRAGW